LKAHADDPQAPNETVGVLDWKSSEQSPGEFDHNRLSLKDEDYPQKELFALSFRLSTSTPLLLVSKDTNSEVTRLLNKMQQLMSSQIYLQRIKQPTAEFLEIASRSRLAFTNGPVEAMFLVKHLPESIKPLITEVAFSLQMWDEDEEADLWGSNEGDLPDVVADCLCSELPDLRTVAMEAPNTPDQLEDWAEASLYRFQDLLESHRIDTLRLFYGDGLGGGADLEVYSKIFGPRNDAEDPEPLSFDALNRGDWIATRDREFDVIEVCSWSDWMTEPRYLEKERLARTFEITRWDDKKLGSDSYKEIVAGQGYFGRYSDDPARH
jgi:hypothetical protein